MLTISLAIVLGTLGLSTICIKSLRLLRFKAMLDIPNPRSSHSNPTLRGGGLGIVISIIIGLWGLYFFKILSTWIKEIVALSLGGTIVAMAGLIDDICHISYRIRLIAQIASALIIVFTIWNIRTITFPFIGDIYLSLMNIPLFLFWIVGLTNAYNFMDGIDGIAGGSAVIAGLGWAIIGYINSAPLIGLIGMLLAASNIGFLFHNWPPARIFMGDVGSAFIGFILAVTTVLAAREDPRSMIAGILIVWPFLFDTAFTLVRRVIRKENIYEPHRSHLYQRLVNAGYSHRFVMLVYMGLALTGAILAILWVNNPFNSDILVIVIPTFLFTCLLRTTTQAEKSMRTAR